MVTISVTSPPQRWLGRSGFEAPLEEIRRDRLVVIAHRRAAVALSHPGTQSLQSHQPGHVLAADGDALGPQLSVHARASVRPAAPLVRDAESSLLAADPAERQLAA